MKKLLFCIAIYILAAFTSNAAGLYVVVKDKTTLETLPAVQISFELEGKKIVATSNAEGTVYIKEIKAPASISCKLIGYESMSKKIAFSDINEKDNKLIIFLEKSFQSINEVVVTGQSTPVMAKNSIYKVNTINASQIAARGAVNLNDVLSYEMNSFVSTDNVLGSSVSIGGIGGQNVKLLVNGIPINGRENGNIDLGQFNMNNIKRVEMIQGPMSVIYGSNALGGVINLITKTPQKKLGIGIRTYLESIGKYNFSGNASYTYKKHQVQISAARNFFQGWTPKDSGDRYQLWKPKTQYTADLQYNLDLKNVKLNYFGSFLNEKISNKGTPIVNAYEGYAFDEYYITNRLINSINGSVKLSSNENFTFTNSYSNYHRAKNRFKKDLVSLQQFETNSVGDQDTSIFNTLNLRGTFASNRIKNIGAMLGYEYTHETGKSNKLSDATKMMSELGIYTSLQYQYRKFSVQPSMRISFNSNYAPGYTPALHAKYSVDDNTQIRASYAIGYRTPSLKELYLQFIDQNHTIIGNPDLKPETGKHIELGIDRQLAVAKGNMNIGFTVYRNEIKNLITLAVFNNQGILRVYENIASYKNWMGNLQAKYHLGDLNVQAGVGMIFVEASSIVPQHQITEINMNSTYYFKVIKSTINVNYKYNSKQPVLTTDEQYLFTNPLHIANASIQRRFFKNSFCVQAGVKNIFNLQTATLTGGVNTQGSGHTSSAGMQLFPMRSLFFDFNYSF